MQRVPRAHHSTETLLLGSTLGETYSNYLAHENKNSIIREGMW